MQTKRSRTSKLTSASLQRQTRAIVNLQQLSQSPWHHSYQDTQTIIPPSITEEKLNINTHESTELPLNPIKHYESPIRRSKHYDGNGEKPRPNTIQNTSYERQGEGSRLSKNHRQPMTALNFYDDNKRFYNAFDDRSRLSEEIQLFASQIRHQTNLIKSIQMTQAKTTGLKQPNNTSISFKTNIAKRSFFYKQFKNFLYSSFKVDGKPVEIKRDRYSIESHGLPKKKSIYSFKEKTLGGNDFFAFSKTDVLRKKVGRYELDGETKETKERKIQVKSNIRSRHSSLMEEDSFLGVRRSLYVEIKDREPRRRLKGKLILGRPPTSLVCQQG